MNNNKNFEPLNVWIEQQLELLNTDYEDLLAQNKNLKNQIKNLKTQTSPLEGFSPDKQKLLKDFINCTIDPNGKFLKNSLEQISERVKTQMGNKVAAIDSDGGINYAAKGHLYDQYLTNFIHGSGGIISDWETEEYTFNALVIRGLGGASQRAIRHCWRTGRTFYAIDTGYFGNGKTKTVHRVTKNALQHLGPIMEKPMDRAKSFGYKFKKFKPGAKILLVPPSDKVMKLFDQPAPEVWVEQTIKQIQQYSNRPIEVRMKPSRSERVSTKTIQAALADDVHCLVTYNSIAAVEALMEGKPSIVLGENAASIIAETSLANIENLKIPSKDEMDAYISHLAYCQFTVEELKSGYAWETVNASS
jgi:hypothetical protein